MRLLGFCYGILNLRWQTNSPKQQGYQKFLIFVFLCWSLYYWHFEAKLYWPMHLNTHKSCQSHQVLQLFFSPLSPWNICTNICLSCFEFIATGFIYLWRAGSVCSKCDIVWMWLYKCLLWGYDVIWCVASVYLLIIISVNWCVTSFIQYVNDTPKLHLSPTWD